MTRADILHTVTKHLAANVESWDPTTVVDPARSLADYGASSLDIAEIVSSCLRELKLKIPRTQLVGIRNIDGLVDAFERALKAQAG